MIRKSNHYLPNFTIFFMLKIVKLVPRRVFSI